MEPQAERERRAAENQALFREVNERVRSIADRLPIEFVCECSNSHCITTIPLTREEYESVREAPDQFFVVPGHEHPEIERLVARNDRYAVVRKTYRPDLVTGEDRPVRQSANPLAEPAWTEAR
jgi:hypothetical protein